VAENSSNRTVSVLLAASLVAMLAAAFGWYRADTELHNTRRQSAGGELHPIAAILQENQGIIRELQNVPFSEDGAGILESYLAKIRRDGVAKHADMKQRLDQLAENNTAVVTLIKAYAPGARTPAFTAEADKFRNYASTWRDRWNSVMELFMAGGNYPNAEVAFPKEFPQAVQAEISAAR
jgi:hypothetical protein